MCAHRYPPSRAAPILHISLSVCVCGHVDVCNGTYDNNFADRGRIGKRKSAQPYGHYGKTRVAGGSESRPLVVELALDLSTFATFETDVLC